MIHRPPLLIFLCLTLSSFSALAFQQSVSDDGVKVFWTQQCLVYHIHDAGSPQIADKESTFSAIRRSFKTWNDVDCSYLRLIDGGFTDITKTGDSDGTRNLGINVVIWRDPGQWPHQKKVIALTSILFNPKSGEISDTDIELNSDFSFTVGDQNVMIDVENTVTHELGHTLGLDHSSHRESTMYESAPGGETKKRDLHSDDIAGICAIYPLANNPDNCDLSNVGFASAASGNSVGCSLSLPASPLNVALILLALLGLVLLVIGRWRQAGTASDSRR